MSYMNNAFSKGREADFGACSAAMSTVASSI